MNRKYEANEKNHLVIGGADSCDLAKEYGTPLYVYDENVILSAMREYKKSIDTFYEGNGLVCFASKAFSCKEMYRIAKREGLGADVVSGGELFTALSVDFPAEKICFHGNNKSVNELELAISAGVGRIVVDSFEELERISEIAKKSGKTVRVMFRIKPGVDAHTHSFIMTGQIDSKFGFAIETGEAMAIIKKALETPNVEVSGIHCHIGSQIHDVEPFIETAKIMIGLMADVKTETGYEMSELNLGGGYGICYTDADDRIQYPVYMERVSRTIHMACAEHGLKLPFILMEPGRSIVGEAGYSLYTVGSVKKIPGVRTYVSIDGGMFENPRYALYEAKYDFILANRTNDKADSVVTIAGKCCESGDLLGKDIELPECKPGDIMAVFSAGAYHYSMASNYNRNCVPPVVFVKDGNSRVVVKGQTYEDIVRNDI